FIVEPFLVTLADLTFGCFDILLSIISSVRVLFSINVSDSLANSKTSSFDKVVFPVNSTFFIVDLSFQKPERTIPEQARIITKTNKIIIFQLFIFSPLQTLPALLPYQALFPFFHKLFS